jgi:hypothetical protein
MIANGYTSLASYKAYQKIDSVDPSDDGFIEQAIDAASRWIDQQSGTRFYTTSADETRAFDAPRETPGLLLFDEYCLSITSVTNGNGASVPLSNILTLPRSAPYYGISLKAGSTLWAPDSSGEYRQAVTVVGKFGSSAVAPSDISLACLEIAKALYGRRFGQNMSMKSIITPAGVVTLPEGVPDWAAMTIANRRRVGFA